MKKLLILGGSKYILPVIKRAHQLGVFVITCDYLPTNYAHKFADKYLNVSIVDKDAVLEAAKKEKIDGIISFACDPGVVTASYVAEKMGLPNVGPYESVCILQNKALFRKFLKDNNFNVPFFKSYKDKKAVEEDAKNFIFPLIVKPSDSAGSKGVSRIDKITDLEKTIDNAFKFSLSGEIIIEEYLEFDGHPSDADSFFSNGKLRYFGTDSQIFDSSAENPFTPAGYYWPSAISKTNQEYLKSELERLFNLLKMRTAIFNIEVRVSKSGKPYIMEASPRGGGNRLTEMIEFATKQDFIGNYLKYSLGIDGFDESSIKQMNFSDGWCQIILHSKKAGIFEGITISDKILKNVIEKDVWIKLGEKVFAFTGANQTIGTLILKFDTESQMKKVMTNIDDYIQIRTR